MFYVILILPPPPKKKNRRRKRRITVWRFSILISECTGVENEALWIFIGVHGVQRQGGRDQGGGKGGGMVKIGGNREKIEGVRGTETKGGEGWRYSDGRRRRPKKIHNGTKEPAVGFICQNCEISSHNTNVM